MIAKAQLIVFDPKTCQPTYYAGSNHFGLFISGRPRRGTARHSWTWPGPAPHATRMHHYASLSGPQKSGWETLAAAMNNDHSAHGVTTYNGPIAYMQTNLYRRLLGMSYTDTAPSTPAMVAPAVVSFQTLGPRFSPLYLAWT